MKSSGFLIRLKKDYEKLPADKRINKLYPVFHSDSMQACRREALRRVTKKAGIPTTIRQPALRNLCYAYSVLNLGVIFVPELRSRLPNQKDFWSVENVAFLLDCSEQTARSYVRTIKYLRDIDESLAKGYSGIQQYKRERYAIKGLVNKEGLKLEGTKKRAYKRSCRVCLENGVLTRFITKNDEEVWCCTQCTELALELIEDRKKRGEG